jgi:gluconokinase
MIVVVLGVSGSGKTTIGTMLARELGCEFLEGDTLHPPRNIEKMSGGTPLTDDDREPWLAAIRARMLEYWRRGDDLVVACSALKRAYRESLSDGVEIAWVYLKASEEVIRARLETRAGHFMKSDMLASQFAALEEPSTDAIIVDASPAPDVIVGQILAKLAVHRL